MAWRDRRVIVAGGTAGFGLVLARHLAIDGARVLVVGRSSAGVRAALEACERDGAPGASATATKDGKNYTISGTATGVNMADPMQPVTEPFEIKVSCP